MDIGPGTWWRGRLGVGHSTVDVVVCVGKSICKQAKVTCREVSLITKLIWGFEGDVPVQRVCPVLTHIGTIFPLSHYYGGLHRSCMMHMPIQSVDQMTAFAILILRTLILFNNC